MATTVRLVGVVFMQMLCVVGVRDVTAGRLLTVSVAPVDVAVPLEFVNTVRYL